MKFAKLGEESEIKKYLKGDTDALIVHQLTDGKTMEMVLNPERGKKGRMTMIYLSNHHHFHLILLFFIVMMITWIKMVENNYLP